MATTDRKILDKRCLEETHLRLSIIDVYKRYKEYFPGWIMHSSLQATLENITPTFYNAFSAKYAGKCIEYVNMYRNTMKPVY